LIEENWLQRSFRGLFGTGSRRWNAFAVAAAVFIPGALPAMLSAGLCTRLPGKGPAVVLVAAAAVVLILISISGWAY